MFFKLSDDVNYTADDNYIKFFVNDEQVAQLDTSGNLDIIGEVRVLQTL